MIKLRDWLTLLGHKDVVDATVTIRGRKYIGCRYTSDFPSRERETFYYLMGTLPACYQRKRATVFRFPGDNRDWYVCAYHDADNVAGRLAAGYKDVSGGGWNLSQNFILGCWDHSKLGCRIDEHTRYVYDRVDVSKTATP